MELKTFVASSMIARKKTRVSRKRRGTVSLAAYVSVAAQWHPTNNGDLTPRQVARGSKLKAWWECPVADDHVWQATVKDRVTKKTGCPACGGTQASSTNNLGLHKEFARQWHPTKNGDLFPQDLPKGHDKKRWWKCPKGPDHEWQESPYERLAKNLGCPFCSGRRVSVTNSLAAVARRVAKQWHPTLNKDLKPTDVTSQSHRKVWWLCLKGPDHEWKATINTRVGKSSGCPFCSGRLPSVTTSLAAIFPEIAVQWHPTKNKSTTAREVVAKSNRTVWWKCAAGPDHEWRATVCNRTHNKSTCPFCAGRKPSMTNSLAGRFPIVAAQWHPTKNGKLRPENTVAGHRRRVWWICAKSSQHEWQATPNARTRMGSGCPVCGGIKASLDHNLFVIFPEVAAQWHPTKNGGTSPTEIPPGSGKRYWWKCPKGPDHEWEAPVGARTHAGAGCPFCRGLRVSVTNSLASWDPDIAAQWHPTKNKVLTAADVVAHSNKRYWWQCQKDPSHSWRAVVNNRTNKHTESGCPKCAPPTHSKLEVQLAFELLLFFEFDPTDHDVFVPGRNKAWDVDILLRQNNLIIEYDSHWWHKEKKDREVEDVAKTESLVADGWRVVRVRQEPLEPLGMQDVCVPGRDMKAAADAVLKRLVDDLGFEFKGVTNYLAADTRQNGNAAKAFLKRCAQQGS